MTGPEAEALSPEYRAQLALSGARPELLSPAEREQFLAELRPALAIEQRGVGLA